MPFTKTRRPTSARFPGTAHPISFASLVTAAALAAIAPDARAEASHHQGAAVGQVAGTVSAAQLQSLASPGGHDWSLQLFPSFLRATHAFDDRGTSLAMPAGTRVENYTLNAYAERRFGEGWAVSALTGWQELRLREGGADRRVSSLADSFLGLRRSDARSWGTLSAIGSVKVPGTYPESALTSTKQVDGQLELLASVQPARWLSLVAGGGYRLRLGGVQDELTATALVPVEVSERFTITPTVLAAIPVGLGDVAKNTVTAGGSIGWTVSRRLDLTAAYYRTLYGRNVVQADVLTVGAGMVY
jgi:hypothetical protein